jgi:predicted RNase H-like nuclease
MSVVGVDGCKGGWIAIALDDNTHARGYLIERLPRLLDVIPDAVAVGIDIPIGLPSAGWRRADAEARQLLGARRSSVFPAPPRQAITAPTHAEATAISKKVTGRGLSRQSFALAPKILETERWVASTPIPVWEVHPEVSFTIMMGRPAASPKSTWAGLQERQRALAHAGIDLDNIGPAGERAGADDVLDAAAAAWSAARLYRGGGISLPDPPETIPDSATPVAIWA